jgi:hypothetical protein
MKRKSFFSYIRTKINFLTFASQALSFEMHLLSNLFSPFSTQTLTIYCLSSIKETETEREERERGERERRQGREIKADN